MKNTVNTTELATEIAEGFSELYLSQWSEWFKELSKAPKIDEALIQSRKADFLRQVSFVLGDSNKDSNGEKIFGSALEYLMHDAITIVEFEMRRNIANAKLGTLPSGSAYADLIKKIKKLSEEVL